jgi:hypothetical protein
VRDATEVCLACQFFCGSFAIFFPRFSIFLVFSNHDQELKEYSHRKSLFIRDESGVWATLAQQRVLVEEA